MKNIVRLTENDITNLVRRVINESNSEMKKILKQYFDDKFNGSVLDIRPYAEEEEWIGIWKDDLLIIGQPEGDPTNTWFSNEQYFIGIKMFGITYHQFNNEMLNYLNDRFPSIHIGEIL